MVIPKNPRGRPPTLPAPRTSEELTKYRTIKVPEAVYQNTLRLQADLIRKGTGSLPAKLSDPDRCPRCGGPVHRLTVGAEFVSCDAAACGYQQQSLAAEATGKTITTLALGMLLGLGVAAVFSALKEDEPEPAARRASLKKRPAKRGIKGGA
jgi:hypothetical protein